jgi:transcriptional regulator with XRE-family HTH domain
VTEIRYNYKRKTVYHGQEVTHMENLAEFIKQARIKKRKTQQQVADEAEVSRPYYADVERGRYTPSLKLLSKLGIILDLDLNFLKQNDGKTSS